MKSKEIDIFLKNPIQWMFITATALFESGLIFLSVIDTNYLNASIFIELMIIILIAAPIVLNITTFFILLIRKPKIPNMYLFWEFIVWTGMAWIFYLSGIFMFYKQTGISWEILFIIILSLMIYSLQYTYAIKIRWPKRFIEWNINAHLLQLNIINANSGIYNITSNWDYDLVSMNRKKERWWDRNIILLSGLSLTVVSIFTILKVQQTIGINKQILGGICFLFGTVLSCESIGAKWFKYQTIRKWEIEHGQKLNVN